MKPTLPALLLALAAATLPAQSRRLDWGDQGNGTYVNPILNADYSDPDVIRVGNRYYMVASDFHYVGMQLLESADLVHWRIVTQVFSRFDVADTTGTGRTDLPGWDTCERYAGGSWAPSIRHHDGRFWIYFCTPHEGLFMTQAERPEGPWSPLHRVREAYHWEDPCPLWDDDGQAYLGRSQHGAGPIILHRMSPDGRTLLDDGVTIYTGPVAEGTKLMKRDGWYYLSIPEGGVERGWQTVLRSRNIYGPYEKRVVLEQGATDVNGPHQGAIVDTPEGAWWFVHFQKAGALGRVVHLQPMHWSEGWPVIGVDIDRNGIGEPVAVWPMPAGASTDPTALPQTSDDFDSPRLGPQWQWNHNPDSTAWSLDEHPGALTLHARRADDFRHARGTLTQRVMGYESEATVALDVTHLAEGGRAGLACIGKGNVMVEVRRTDGSLWLCRLDEDATGKPISPGRTGEDGTGKPISPGRTGEDGTDGHLSLGPLRSRRVVLRLTMDIPRMQYRMAYSTDGTHFTPAGEPFFVDFGHWKGVRFGLYHYNTLAPAGYVTSPWVRYEILR